MNFFAKKRSLEVPPKARPDYAAWEKIFGELFEVRRRGTALFFRPSGSGSYFAEDSQIERFLKKYLADRGEAHLWSTDAVKNFRLWLATSAAPMPPDVLVRNKER